MPNAVTPKEQLTAYQRWELPAFDMVKEGGTPSTIDLPTAAQLENIHIQAHEEGYQTGYAEGMKQASTEAGRITNLLESLNKELQQVNEQIAQDLLNLALEIAKQMLQQALKIKPELLLNVVRAAISELPYFNQNVLKDLKEGKNVIIAAHGNSLRAIVMEIEKLTKGQVLELNIPTATPIVYEFDQNLKIISKKIL